MVAFSRFLARVQPNANFGPVLVTQLKSKEYIPPNTDISIFVGLDVFDFADKLKELEADFEEDQLDHITEFLRSEMIHLVLHLLVFC
jgi:hypothetical protein